MIIVFKRCIDKLFGSHLEKLDQLERDLYDWKVKAAKLEDANYEYEANEERYDAEIRSLTRDLQDALAKYTNATEANDKANKLSRDALKQIIELQNKNIDLRKCIQDLKTENDDLKQQLRFQFPLTPWFVPYRPGQPIFTCATTREGDIK